MGFQIWDRDSDTVWLDEYGDVWVFPSQDEAHRAAVGYYVDRQGRGTIEGSCLIQEHNR